MSALPLLLTALSALDVIGADWAAVPAQCLPGIDALDWRAEIQEESGAIIWWCEDEQRGLVEHSRASSRGRAAVVRLLVDTRDAAFMIDSAVFRLRPTTADVQLIADLRQRYTPLCRVIDSHATNEAGEQVGELREGQWLACGGLRKRDDVHVCLASGAPQSDGTLLPADSWVRCEIQRAPQAGWDFMTLRGT